MRRTPYFIFMLFVALAPFLLGCQSNKTRDAFPRQLAVGMTQQECLRLMARRGAPQVHGEARREEGQEWESVPTVYDNVYCRLWLKSMSAEKRQAAVRFVQVDLVYGFMGLEEFYLWFDASDRLVFWGSEDLE